MEIAFPDKWAPNRWSNRVANQKEAARKSIGKIPSGHYLIAMEAISLQNCEAENTGRKIPPRSLSQLRKKIKSAESGKRNSIIDLPRMVVILRCTVA